MPISVLRGESAPGDRWRDSDASLAVALTLYEDDLCSGCGHPLSETTDPQADPNNAAGSWGYRSGDPVRCHACDAAGIAAERHAKNDPPRPQAIKLGTRRIDWDDKGLEVPRP